MPHAPKEMCLAVPYNWFGVFWNAKSVPVSKRGWMIFGKIRWPPSSMAPVWGYPIRWLFDASVVVGFDETWNMPMRFSVLTRLPSETEKPALLFAKRAFADAVVGNGSFPTTRGVVPFLVNWHASRSTISGLLDSNGTWAFCPSSSGLESF